MFILIFEIIYYYREKKNLILKKFSMKPIKIARKNRNKIKFANDLNNFNNFIKYVNDSIYFSFY